MMQTDVLSGHLNQSGQLVVGRTRFKGALIAGAASGTVNFWDATTAQTSATYARSGTTVTVTKTSHGLLAGQSIGLTFAAGGATNGNYVIQTATANTFTVTDINSGTVAAGTACSYNTRWLTSVDTGDTTFANLLIPGEGMVCQNGIYAQIANCPGVTIYYG